MGTDPMRDLRTELDEADALVDTLHRIMRGEQPYLGQAPHLQVAWWAGIASVQLSVLVTRVRRLLETGYPF